MTHADLGKNRIVLGKLESIEEIITTHDLLIEQYGGIGGIRGGNEGYVNALRGICRDLALR